MHYPICPGRINPRATDIPYGVTMPTLSSQEIISLWLEQYKKPERINFAIVLKETKELIGGIDVVGYLEGPPVIGYVLSRKYWNHGYMSEACKKVIELLFDLGHEKIIIDAVKENVASNKVIEKCGGIYEKTVFEPDREVNLERYWITL